jgi:integrase
MGSLATFQEAAKVARHTLNKLTTKGIQKLIREAKRTHRPVSKSDGGGLTFTVSKTGYPAWVLRYRIHGKDREYTLETDAATEDFGVTGAREERDKLRKRVSGGEDIASTKKLGDPSGLSTFKALADEWYSRQIKPKVQNPQIVLGAIAPGDLEPQHIDGVLQTIVEREAPTIANDALSYIKRILTYARKRKVVTHNIAADFDLTDAGGREKPRSRNLTREELADLFKAMRNTPTLGRENELAFKILLATCVRKSELVMARWEEFDLDEGVWCLPAERTKTESGIKIPLAAPVVEWFRELKVFAAKSDCVLPKRRIAKRSSKPHISPDTLNVALGRVGHSLAHFTIHDLRRTARSRLSELGVSQEVAERALNHKLKGIAAVYNHHDYFEERKEALTLWADLLAALDVGEDYNVVPIGTERTAG